MADWSWLQENKTAIYVASGVGLGVGLGWVLRKRVRSCPKNAINEIDQISPSSLVVDDADLKLVFVVRMDLKMGKGKMAAQCAHAAVMAFEGCARTHPELLHAWRDQGQAKVVTRCNDLDELKTLASHAKRVGLGTYMVRDAGRTQVEAGSVTVLAVGPGPVQLINQVTGEQKLL